MSTSKPRHRPGGRPWPLGLWAALLLGLAPGLTLAECKLKALDLPVTLIDGRPIIELGFNGTPKPLLVDSGAFYSVITPAVADELQLPTRSGQGLRLSTLGGHLRARISTVRQLQLGQGTVADVEFIHGLNEVGGGAVGVVGRNVLGVADTEYDLGHGRVRVIRSAPDCRDDQLAYWAADEPVDELPLVKVSDGLRPPIIVPIEINGRRVHALLDTGAGGVLIDRGLLSSEEQARLVPTRPVGGGGSGGLAGWSIRLHTVTLGRDTLHEVPAGVSDLKDRDYQVLVGVDWFLSHRLIVSPQRGKLLVTRLAGPVFPEPPAEHAAPGTPPAAEPFAPEPALDQPGPLMRRGMAALGRHNFAQATADLDAAVALAPTDATLHLNRARVRLAMKRRDEALVDLDQALSLLPTMNDARLLRARARQEAGDATGAREDLRQLQLALSPQAHAHAAMGDLWDALGETDTALAEWDRWLAAHESDGGRGRVLTSRCWAQLSDAGADARRLTQAEADCQQAVELQPLDGMMHEHLGWARLRRGDAAGALSAFDRAIELLPSGAQAWLGRAVVHQQAGRPDAAAADLVMARQRQADVVSHLRRAPLMALVAPLLAAEPAGALPSLTPPATP